MLTYLFGPFMALLPRRWRESLSVYEAVEWRTAMILSAFGESVVALVGMMYWYSYSVTGWVERGIDATLSGRAPAGITDHDIGVGALLIFATHPLTWLLLYAGFEGSVRLLGALASENYLGILPLFALDKLYLKISGRSGPGAAKAAGYSQSHFSSYVSALREKARAPRYSNVPDELCFSRDGPEEILEIRACRRKEDWTPPRTVRYQDAFYRLESSTDGSIPRAYHYRLRRVTAGVMGRSVLIYSPEEPIVIGKT